MGKNDAIITQVRLEGRSIAYLNNYNVIASTADVSLAGPEVVFSSTGLSVRLSVCA